MNLLGFLCVVVLIIISNAYWLHSINSRPIRSSHGIIEKRRVQSGPVNVDQILKIISLRYHSSHKIQLSSLYNSLHILTEAESALLPDIIPVSSYEISDRQALDFSRKGHLFVPNLINPEFLSKYLLPTVQDIYSVNRADMLRHKVRVTLGREDAEDMSEEELQSILSTVDQGDIPFMQSFNLWRTSTIPKVLALSPELGKVAARLLGVKRIRLYQDSVFIKRSGDGETLWHSDLNMCPFDTNDFITCWIPLQEIPSQKEGGTSLSFASGSHRDFALSYWNDFDSMDLSYRYQVESYSKFSVGDCSFHHGWCLHSAPANTSPNTRYAFSISFVADGARVLQEEGHIRYPDSEDDQSYLEWFDDVGWGGVADHNLLPIVYSDNSDIA